MAEDATPETNDIKRPPRAWCKRCRTKPIDDDGEKQNKYQYRRKAKANVNKGLLLLFC